MIFGFKRSDSVSQILLEIGLPSFILFYTTVVLFSGVLGANVPIYWCHVFVSFSCVSNCALILYSFLVWFGLVWFFLCFLSVCAALSVSVGAGLSQIND